MSDIIVEKELKVLRDIGNSFEETEKSFANKNVRYSKSLFDKYQNVDIADDILPIKYCYTPEQGFYENPNWSEPDTSNTFGIPDDVYMAIKEQAIQEVQNELNK